MEFLTPDIVPVLSIGIALAALIGTQNWRNSRSIKEQFDSMTANTNQRFEALEKRQDKFETKLEERLTEYETKFNDRLDELETKVDTNQIKLETKIFDLDKQMTHLAGLLEGLREAVVGRRVA